ncbi:hypothetical protein EJG51_004110 [Undibacterium piscinae]|uniref:Uncharacterized protein n=1 Tax=Undibacterium piscinae TaxID=2495591 RepID=A0A6M4A255_9BURK|nr:hypothetical protein EJG51_004110 [Undibacterium piscinae]
MAQADAIYRVKKCGKNPAQTTFTFKLTHRLLLIAHALSFFYRIKLAGKFLTAPEPHGESGFPPYKFTYADIRQILY